MLSNHTTGSQERYYTYTISQFHNAHFRNARCLKGKVMENVQVGSFYSGSRNF